MTTVHAYTASQKLVDGPAKNWRRGRAAAVNFVPTSTGAAVATTKVLPQYQGMFDGVAIRGPVPVGSISDITMVTQRPTSIDEVNQIFEEEAASNRYNGVLGVVERAHRLLRHCQGSERCRRRFDNDQCGRRRSGQSYELVRQRMGLCRPDGA